MGRMTVKTRIEMFCSKNQFEYEWQPLRFGFERAAVVCNSWHQHQAVAELARKLKGVAVRTWTCNLGEFEGYVYLMDAKDEDELYRLLTEEARRNEDWWQRYHAADQETKRLMARGDIK